LTFESIIRSQRAQEPVLSGPLGPFIDSFVQEVEAIGYAPSSLYDVILGASWFARYLSTIGVTDVRQIRDSHVRNFLATLPACKCNGGKNLMHSVRGSRGARSLVKHLRSKGVIPPEPVAANTYSWLLEPWIAFLTQHGGLASGTLYNYRSYGEQFLQHLGDLATPDRFAAMSPAHVREYLQREAARFAFKTRNNLVSSLRSLFRFAFSAGHLQRDLASTIGRVPCSNLDRLPRGPKWEDLPKVLAAIDSGTKQGLRDYAMLLTLITYGVRASQLGGLCLDDVHWREDQIIFPSAKGGRPVSAPLTAAVGDALLKYIRNGRPATEARRVFLSLATPFHPLSPRSIYNVVCRAFRLSSVASPHKGSHAIRHAWATRAFAQGHTLKTVSDLLGHRSIESTRIYTKVDYTQLRQVGLSWPEEVQK
jgi:integrase/recombinase XerD